MGQAHISMYCQLPNGFRNNTRSLCGKKLRFKTGTAPAIMLKEGFKIGWLKIRKNGQKFEPRGQFSDFGVFVLVGPH